MTTTTLDTIAAGVHENIPFETYLSMPGWSQSSLKGVIESPKHGKAIHDDELGKVPTDDMNLGSALHTAFLEPELMPERVVLWDGGTRRGKAWDAFKSEQAGKVILTPGMYENMQGMTRALRQHPEVKRWRAKMDAVEVSAIGTLEGLPFKARTDAMTADPLIDLKKVQSTDPRLVRKTVRDYRYDIQGAIYCRMFNRNRFILMCVEGTPPYDVVPYELSPGLLEAGWEDAKRLIGIVKECEASGVWPGRSNEVVVLTDDEWDGKVRIS